MAKQAYPPLVSLSQEDQGLAVQRLSALEKLRNDSRGCKHSVLQGLLRQQVRMREVTRLLDTSTSFPEARTDGRRPVRQRVQVKPYTDPPSCYSKAGRKRSAEEPAEFEQPTKSRRRNDATWEPPEPPKPRGKQKAKGRPKVKGKAGSPAATRRIVRPESQESESLELVLDDVAPEDVAASGSDVVVAVDTRRASAEALEGPRRLSVIVEAEDRESPGRDGAAAAAVQLPETGVEQEARAVSGSPVRAASPTHGADRMESADLQLNVNDEPVPMEADTLQLSPNIAMEGVAVTNEHAIVPKDDSWALDTLDSSLLGLPHQQDVLQALEMGPAAIQAHQAEAKRLAAVRRQQLELMMETKRAAVRRRQQEIQQHNMTCQVEKVVVRAMNGVVKAEIAALRNADEQRTQRKQRHLDSYHAIMGRIRSLEERKAKQEGGGHLPVPPIPGLPTDLALLGAGGHPEPQPGTGNLAAPEPMLLLELSSAEAATAGEARKGVVDGVMQAVDASMEGISEPPELPSSPGRFEKGATASTAPDKGSSDASERTGNLAETMPAAQEFGVGFEDTEEPTSGMPNGSAARHSSAERDRHSPHLEVESYRKNSAHTPQAEKNDEMAKQELIAHLIEALPALCTHPQAVRAHETVVKAYKERLARAQQHNGRRAVVGRPLDGYASRCGALLKKGEDYLTVGCGTALADVHYHCDRCKLPDKSEEHSLDADGEPDFSLDYCEACVTKADWQCPNANCLSRWSSNKLVPRDYLQEKGQRDFACDSANLTRGENRGIMNEAAVFSHKKLKEALEGLPDHCRHRHGADAAPMYQCTPEEAQIHRLFENGLDEGVPVLITDMGRYFDNEPFNAEAMQTLALADKEKSGFEIKAQFDDCGGATMRTDEISVRQFFAPMIKTTDPNLLGTDPMEADRHVGYKAPDFGIQPVEQSKAFRDGMKRLGVGHLVRHDGLQNLGHYLLSEKEDHVNGTQKPDLGPKFYIARPRFIRKTGPGPKFSFQGHTFTPLHCDLADAVNYSCFGEEATWTIFHRKDRRAVMRFLEEEYGEGTKRGEDMLWAPSNHRLLSKEDLCKLAEEYDVRPWQFKQRAGELVVIPAGCAHQVKNGGQNWNIKVAQDFVAPHSASTCLELLSEMRTARQEDKLQAVLTLRFAGAAAYKDRKICKQLTELASSSKSRPSA